MSSVKRGDKNRPSRVRYHSEGRRNRNKVFRIERCCGRNYLLKWGKTFGVDVIGILEAGR